MLVQSAGRPDVPRLWGSNPGRQGPDSVLITPPGRLSAKGIRSQPPRLWPRSEVTRFLRL